MLLSLSMAFHLYCGNSLCFLAWVFNPDFRNLYCIRLNHEEKSLNVIYKSPRRSRVVYFCKWRQTYNTLLLASYKEKLEL